MKKKFSSTNCLGVPRPKGEIIVVADACDVGGAGIAYQWRELNPVELAHCQWYTSGANRDGTLKHDYPGIEWRLLALGHCNWKWNEAWFNYSTYGQELLAGMLVLSSRSRLLATNPIVWLCDQEPVKTFQKGPLPEKAKRKRYWSYLRHFRLTIDVQLDLSMRTVGLLEGWSLRVYQQEYQCELQNLSDALEVPLIDGERWYKDSQYDYYDDRKVVPEARLDGCRQWAHLTSGHRGCNRSVHFFYSQLTLRELQSQMHSTVDSCGCHARKQRNSWERGLISSLPILYCAKSLFSVDLIPGLPRF